MAGCQLAAFFIIAVYVLKSALKKRPQKFGFVGALFMF